MAVYKVGADGKAQSGLKAGDQVVTGGGTYTITGVNADGTYQSSLTNKNQTTSNYAGNYGNGAVSTGNTGGTVKSGTTTSVSSPNAVTDTKKYHTGSGIYYSTVGEKVDQASKNATWDANTDYSTLLNKQIGAGASVDTVYNTLASRLAKANSDESLSRYAWDDTTREAIRYMVKRLGGSLDGIDAVAAAQATLAARNGDYTLWNELGLGGSSGLYSGSSAANRYSGSAASSGVSGASGVTDYSDYLKELYDAQIAANLAALESAYKQNVNALDSAAILIPDQYEAARNQAAAAAAQSQRSFNQQASAKGLGTGVGAQATLANNVALQNNLATVNSAEATALADLELQRTQLTTDYQTAIAQAQANGNYQLADALYTESVRVSEALQAQQNYLQELALEQARYESQLAATQASNDYSNGLELAQYLYNATGDASGFAAYGYSNDQIAALQNQWALANATGSTGSGSASAVSTPVVSDPVGNGEVDTTELDSAVSALAQMVNAGEVSQSVAEQVLTELEQGGSFSNGALWNNLAGKTLIQRAKAKMGL